MYPLLIVGIMCSAALADVSPFLGVQPKKTGFPSSYPLSNKKSSFLSPVPDPFEHCDDETITETPPPDSTTPSITTGGGCPASLKCVEEKYCTADGYISPVPVVFNKEEDLRRVPTTDCKIKKTGITGKCCRDPIDKDPWPSANLVDGVDDGQYKEDNFYGQHELLKNNRFKRSSTGSATNQNLYRLAPQGTCGQRHRNTKPKGEGPFDANFAEFPWQAMIFHTNCSFLCGGVIVRTDIIVTKASCIEGLPKNEIYVAAGDWKLKSNDEPLPVQRSRINYVDRHYVNKKKPRYNDIVALILDDELHIADNVQTICIPPADQSPRENCVVTGWGHKILEGRPKGALMHRIDVNITDSKQCEQVNKEHFQKSNGKYSTKVICAEPKLSNADQCEANYGSALACANSQGQYFLIGIYAWDTGCRQKGQIGGYYPTDFTWFDDTLRT